jgi:predicted lipid-binding transport protein (Tim44 family)
MDILIFAAVAAFILYRLYKVLGKDIGFKPGSVPEAAPELPVSRMAASKHSASNELTEKVFELQKLDPRFEQTSFLEGASHAFEMILSAFNQGDKSTLNSLLDPKIYMVFEKAISTREKREESWDNTLIRVQSKEINDIRIEKRTHALVTVKFVSDQILVTKDKDGKVIEGDPDQIEVITDLWTFVRDTTSQDPNWLLLKTSQSN